MDLIIPGEQYFYLKARNAVERQKWLVALGTAKACLTDSRTQKEKGKNTLLLAHPIWFLFPHPYPSRCTHEDDLNSESSLCFRSLVPLNAVWEL